MQAGDWIFEDALRSGGATQESVPAENGFWGDLGTGALLFSEHLWFGASAQQLLRPRWPFTWATEADRLPRYWAVHGGGRFRIGSEGLVLAPSLQVRHQAPSTAADISLEAQFSPLFVGAVYRGLPLLQDEANAAYQDAAGLLAGVQYEAWKISLSYDLVLNGSVQSGGNVELVLSFRPPQDRRRPASWRHVRCPVY
jgi:type IX secretion system PorP/SprF family membrane protein